MSNKAVKSTTDEKKSAWEELHPEILALIFLKTPLIQMVACLPLVCKAWMEVLAAPYFWRDIDIKAWCVRNPYQPANQVVKELIRRSNCTVQRLSASRMGESGFISVVDCGRSLEVLEIPTSNITDQMILTHLIAMPNLRVLDISNCFRITAKGLATIGSQCKSLVHLKRNITPPYDYLGLRINNSEAITIADTMPNLQRIELCFGRFGDSGVSEILTKCKSLKYLDIRGSWNVNLKGDLKMMCGKLECFLIHGNDISDKDRRWLYRNWMENSNDRDIFVEFEACRKGRRRLVSLFGWRDW